MYGGDLTESCQYFPVLRDSQLVVKIGVRIWLGVRGGRPHSAVKYLSKPAVNFGLGLGAPLAAQ